jgi:splicing factor 3A subunit 1
MAATNGDSNMEDVVSKAPEGTILPPTEARKVIEKTAGYVARNGIQFEEQLREKTAGNNKMSFILPDDAYFAYYRWRMGEIKAGRGNAISAGREGEVSFQGREERKGPEPPEEFMFSARVPNISAQDLDVVKLTALFVAKNGRGWMTQLSQREAGNFQFDFLRPQHTLYQFFSRLVDQYQDLLTGDSADGGKPQKKRIASLEQNIKERFQVLDRAKKRAEWVKHQEAQKVAKEEQQEKERVEYAQIDWHDFVVVETVVFDERDENTELPAPTTMNDLQSASLEQKAAMSINPNMRLEEAFPSFNDQEQFYGQQQHTHTLKHRHHKCLHPTYPTTQPHPKPNKPTSNPRHKTTASPASTPSNKIASAHAPPKKPPAPQQLL